MSQNGLKRELNVGANGLEDVKQGTIFHRNFRYHARDRLSRLNDSHLTIKHQVEGENLTEYLRRDEWLCGYKLKIVRQFAVKFFRAICAARCFWRSRCRRSNFCYQELNVISHLNLWGASNRPVALLKVQRLRTGRELLVGIDGRYVVGEESLKRNKIASQIFICIKKNPGELFPSTANVRR